MRLAGTYHPIAYLIERVWETVPGIASVVGCWRDYNKNLRYSIASEMISLSQENEVFLQDFRKTKANYNWLRDANLFDQTKAATPLTLETEQELRSLAIYFDSPVDGYKDILILSFTSQIGVKNADLDFKALSTGEKFILSTFLTQQLQAEYKRVLEERNILHHLSKTSTNQNEELVLLRDKLKETEQKYSSAIAALITEIKDELVQKFGKKVTFKDGIIQRLATEQLPFNAIKTVLTDAVTTAYHLNVVAEEIEIYPHHIHIANTTKKTAAHSINQVRKDKVMLLLDRYEDGAILAIQKGLPVNGKNVATHLDDPVSPPAITDALKKNKKRIRFLLEEYPNNWPQIRKGLRPLALISEEIVKKRIAI